MFLSRRARRQARIHERCAEPVADPPLSHEPQQLEDWRHAAQRVRRTWNAWLAADGHERGVWYRAFVLALAEEECAAAEVERMTEHAQADERGAASPSLPLAEGHVGGAAEPEVAGG